MKPENNIWLFVGKDTRFISGAFTNKEEVTEGLFINYSSLRTNQHHLYFQLTISTDQ
jgi:hypothetical protein